MSVLVLDLKVYQAIYNKALYFQHNKVCDINFCQTLREYTPESLKKLIYDWLWLNNMSYLRRYREEPTPKLHEFLKLKETSEKPISTVQFFKFLQCLYYNIEIETIKTGYSGTEPAIIIDNNKLESYEVLKKTIEDLSNAIISNIPEYQQSKWSSFEN